MRGDVIGFTGNGYYEQEAILQTEDCLCQEPGYYACDCENPTETKVPYDEDIMWHSEESPRHLQISCCGKLFVGPNDREDAYDIDAKDWNEVRQGFVWNIEDVTSDIDYCKEHNMAEEQQKLERQLALLQEGLSECQKYLPKAN